MGARRIEYNRFSPDYLVQHTPTRSPASVLPYLTLVITTVGLALVGGVLLSQVWAYLWIAAPFIVGPIAWKLWRPSLDRLLKLHDESWMARQRSLIVVAVDTQSFVSTVAAIKAGSWVCLEREYKHEKARYKLENGPQAGPPPVPYRLAIAIYRVNGTQTLVGFSDGTFESWYPSSHVLHRGTFNPPANWRPAEYEEFWGSAAAALEKIVAQLSTCEPKSMYTDELLKAMERRFPEVSVYLALHVAEWWGIVGINDEDDFVFLTDGGQVWAEASESSQQAIGDGRRRTGMAAESQGSGPVFNFHGAFSGNLYSAGRDIKGRHAVQVSSSPSSEDLRAAVQEILSTPDLVDWNDPALDGVREELERTMYDGSPENPQSKSAVRKLVEYLGGFGTGIAVNASYEILKHYATA